MHKSLRPVRTILRVIPALLVPVLLILAIPSLAIPALAADAEALAGERAMGSPDAPVTMIEFSSFTCPHCADFHKETLPRIKEEYIDTGKVQLVLTDFPLDPLAMGAAMLARCVQPDRYFGFVDALFSSQSSWARSSEPIRELERLAQFAGLPPSEFKACLENRELLQALQQKAEAAKTQYNISSTPTFVIDGEKVVGAQPFEKFQSVIEEKLGEKPSSEDHPKSTQRMVPGDGEPERPERVTANVAGADGRPRSALE